MGTPDFAVDTLEQLVKHHEVVGVFTQPDKPKGRGKKMAFPPVKECALKYDLPIYQPDKIRLGEWPETIRSLHPEIIVVVAYGQLLSQEILDIPRFGCINVHASLLPKYRGAAPINWAIIDGEPVTGVTTMLMAAGLDTGDMLLKREVAVERKNAGDLTVELASVGAELLIETLDKILKNELVPEVQDDSLSTYAKMLNKNLALIDWGESASKIEMKIRGFNPWPVAHTKYNDETLKIFSADVIQNDDFKEAANGEIVQFDKKSIWVKTGDGILSILELQLGSNKRMTTQAFLLGNEIKLGMILGQQEV